MGWWFGRKSAPADARPFVPAWLQSDAAEEGFARFLTFEVAADEEPPTLGALLTDASRGAVSSEATEPLAGFAAYGRSIKSAIEPLVDSFGVELFDDGETLRPPASISAISIDDDELGNSADNEAAGRVQRELLPARAVPDTLRLTFYDPARDYQAGEARADFGELAGNQSQQELPAVLSASDAKSLAQTALARAWARRDKLTLRLPPARLAIEPGSRLDVPLTPSLWTVEKVSIEAFVVIAQLRPLSSRDFAVEADGGRIVSSPDIAAGPVSLTLLDIPNVPGGALNDPVILIAASTPSTGWKRIPVTISFGDQLIAAQSARTKSVLGRALTILAAGATELIDDETSVDVVLIDDDQWLTSCDDDALAAGDNLAAIGDEVIQFGRAVALGGGKFRLSRLLRGRGGTEWACATHGVGDAFCLLQPETVKRVALPSWSMGSLVTASGGVAGASIEFAGEAVRPLSPVNLAAAFQSPGGLAINWTRRSRAGFAWVDGIDAPLGEAREQYDVVVRGSQGAIETVSVQPTLTIPVEDLASLGTGVATIEVRQVGDLGASRPAQLTVNLS